MDEFGFAAKRPANADGESGKVRVSLVQSARCRRAVGKCLVKRRG